MPTKKTKKKSSMKDKLRKKQQRDIKNAEGGAKKSVMDLSAFEGAKFYKHIKGKTAFDIIPYVVATNNHPEEKKGDEDYVLNVWVHRNVGISDKQYLCLNKMYDKPCPICEEIKVMWEEEDPDEDAIKALYPKHRTAYNIIDLNNEDKGIQIFEHSFHLFAKDMLEESTVAEDEVIVFADPEEGRSIKCRGSEKSFGKSTFIEYKSFSFIERDSIDEEIMEESYPLDAMLIIPTYDEVKNTFLGIDNEDEEVEEEVEDEEVEEEVEDEEVEEEVEEEPKKMKRNTKKTKEKKTSKKKSKCPHGYKFGDDCEEHDDCDDCESWDECSDEE